MRELVATLLAWGPGGVLVLAGLDSAGIPIPGGVDALLVAVSASGSPATAWWSAALATIGSLVGSMVLFYIARKGGEAYLKRQMERSERARRFNRWFHHYGLLTVFIPALAPIPLPLKIFVVSAGALCISPLSFLAVVLAARVIRYFALAYLGLQLGAYSVTYLKEHALELTGIAVALFVVLFVAVKLKDRARAALSEAS